MLMENIDYFTRRLHCTEEEKDACLKTVVEVLHLWNVVRREGVLALGFSRGDQEPDPFFRACLRDTGDLLGVENETRLKELFLQYLAAGDYRGGDFLRAVVIAEGILLLTRLIEKDPNMPGFRKWGEELSLAVRGYFGVEYRDKVEKTILREVRKYEKAARQTSVVPEFDTLAELPPELCLRLWQEIAEGGTMAIALKYAGEAARDRILSVLSPEEQERMEDDMELCTFLREKDVKEAQGSVLEKAASFRWSTP